MSGRKDIVIGLILWLMWGFFWPSVRALREVTSRPARYSYTPDELHQLRPAAVERLSLDLPAEMRPRKRGRRGGERVKYRQRRFKPVLPTVIMGNVQSLNDDKVYELSGLTKYDRLFRQCSLLCFTETWLTDTDPDSKAELDGFTLLRQDRDLKRTNKKKGGGVCLYVNNQWCHPGHITVKERVSDKDIELLAVSCRPYYLPREFSNIIVLVVYIHPKANAKCATDIISRVTHDLQRKSPDALTIINGDFNHCTLSSSLPSFRQFVTCRTRKEKTIDLFYANVKNSFSSTALPALGGSDHNMVSLSPRYTPLVRRQPASSKSVRVWSDDACEELRACFECTDWSVFHDEDNNVDNVADCVSEYINFCVDMIIPCKTIKLFPNNKPGVTKEN